jgi:hypothetical protein
MRATCLAQLILHDLFNLNTFEKLNFQIGIFETVCASALKG